MESSEFNISLAKEFAAKVTEVKTLQYCSEIDQLSLEDLREVTKQLLHLYIQTKTVVAEMHKYPTGKAVEFAFEQISKIKPLDTNK